MESDKEIISFIVIASSGIILLLIAIVVDFFVLYERRKTINKQEIELRERRIDELIRKQEVESVNALLKGQNAERRRISQELHDRLGGILFTAKLYNGSMEKKLAKVKTEHRTGYQKLTKLLDEAVDEVRRISHDLYEGSVARFGYSTVLRQLISAIDTSDNPAIDFQDDLESDILDEAKQKELYAITQELLSNTLKHAGAGAIHIHLRSDAKNIDFTYADNGLGFDPEKDTDGIGLENIKNRAARLNANLTFETAPGKGTKYNLSIPQS